MASSTLGNAIPKIIACTFVTAIATFGVFILAIMPKVHAAGVEWPFMILTGIFGAFLIAAGLYTLYALTWQDTRNDRIAARYPDQPWMLNSQWADGKLVDRPIGRIVFHLVFMIGWVSGISLVLTRNWPQVSFALRYQASAWLLAAFFALLTAAVFNLLFQSVAQGWRVGSAMLTLDTIPGRLGGTFAARFNCRLSPDAPKRLTATLTCDRRAAHDRTLWRPDDKTHMLWWQEIEITPRRSKGRLVAEVHFDVPDDLPESGIQANLDDIVWMLRVDTGSRTKGALNFQWEVPVFATDRTTRESRRATS